MINIIDTVSKILENDIKQSFKLIPCNIVGYDYTIIGLSKDFEFTKLLYDDFEIIKVKIHHNIKLNNNFIVNNFNDLLLQNNYDDLILKTNDPKNIIIDYSSPNVAKEMHVGHLRSTIIGDTLSNFYEILGHNVSRINHIGDFGLQFGQIVNYIIKNNLQDNIEILNLQELYVKADNLAKNDEQFKIESQQRTYELQNNIEPTSKIHKEICNKSRKHFNENYSILNIQNLKEIGESFYQNLIPNMIKELEEKNILEEQDNCKIIKTNIKNKESKLTLIKSNGGYTYDTTDLCAMKYRIQEQNADKIYYVVDSGQSGHFEQIFETSKKINWITKQEIKHINFGVILGEDGTRIRSRDGTTLKLLDLFEETIKQTEIVLRNKNPLISQDDIKSLAIGSIKYADLKTDRKNNYKFSYEKMLSFTGNTLCYIMYCYVRINKVITNYLSYFDNITKNIKIEELNDYDLNVIKYISKLPECINKILSNNELHHLTTYLYELVELSHIQYKNNRILDFDPISKVLIKSNDSRVNIFVITKHIMIYIFNILNIKPIEHM